MSNPREAVIRSYNTTRPGIEVGDAPRTAATFVWTTFFAGTRAAGFKTLRDFSNDTPDFQGKSITEWGEMIDNADEHGGVIVARAPGLYEGRPIAIARPVIGEAGDRSLENFYIAPHVVALKPNVARAAGIAIREAGEQWHTGEAFEATLHANPPAELLHVLNDPALQIAPHVGNLAVPQLVIAQRGA